MKAVGRAQVLSLETTDALPVAELPDADQLEIPLNEMLDDYERLLITRALDYFDPAQRHNGNLARALAVAGSLAGLIVAAAAHLAPPSRPTAPTRRVAG